MVYEHVATVLLIFAVFLWIQCAIITGISIVDVYTSKGNTLSNKQFALMILLCAFLWPSLVIRNLFALLDKVDSKLP